jgi:hypothetical protein
MIGDGDLPPGEGGKPLKVQFRLRPIGLPVADAVALERCGYPLASEIVTDNLMAMILLRQDSKLSRSLRWIEWRLPAPNDVNDRPLVLTVGNAESKGVMTARTGVRECHVPSSRPRGQFERPAVIDRSVYQLIVQERRNV